MQKPIDRMFGFLIAAVGVIMWIIPKTPLTITGALILVLIFLIHPVWNFWWIEKSRYRQWVALVGMVLCVSIFGFFVWPDPPQHSLGKQMLQAQGLTAKNEAQQSAHRKSPAAKESQNTSISPKQKKTSPKLFNGQQTAQWSEDHTSSAAVVIGRCIFHGVMVRTDGINDVMLNIYDGIDASGKTVLFPGKQVLPGPMWNTTPFAAGQTPGILMSNGIYVSISVAGGGSVVYKIEYEQ